MSSLGKHWKRKSSVWSKGLTKDTDDRLKKVGEKISNTRKQLFKEKKILPNRSMLGKKSWNNGLTKENDERINLRSMKFNVRPSNNTENN